MSTHAYRAHAEPAKSEIAVYPFSSDAWFKCPYCGGVLPVFEVEFSEGERARVEKRQEERARVDGQTGFDAKNLGISIVQRVIQAASYIASWPSKSTGRFAKMKCHDAMFKGNTAALRGCEACWVVEFGK